MSLDPENPEKTVEGQAFAPGRLNAVVYAQLKSAARLLLQNRHRAEASLTPSSLVHDAWLRLAANDRAHWPSERHFRSAAATAMRHILIDRARRKKTDKHGTGWLRITLTGRGDVPLEVGVEALSDALTRLASFDPRGATIVEMRFLGGMTNLDIGAVLELSERTVERDWRAARAWLLQALTS